MDTAFYLGGSLGFLLALLGWSDQIRGTQEKTRGQEREFLETYKTRWQDLRAVIRPSEDAPADQRLLSVLRLLKYGHLKDQVDVGLLEQFEHLDEIRTRLEGVYTVRYWLILVITAEMFSAGVLSSHFTGAICACTRLNWEYIYSAPCLVLIASIIALTFVVTIYESRLRRALNNIEDALRVAKEHRSLEVK